jgi:hypothetical protein
MKLKPLTVGELFDQIDEMLKDDGFRPEAENKQLRAILRAVQAPYIYLTQMQWLPATKATLERFIGLDELADVAFRSTIREPDGHLIKLRELAGDDAEVLDNHCKELRLVLLRLGMTNSTFADDRLREWWDELTDHLRMILRGPPQND